MSMPKDFLHYPSNLMIRIDEDPSGGYFGLVPALPGCGSQGDTVQETLANVSEALTAILDLVRQDDPGRYADLVGSSTSREDEGEGSKPNSTNEQIEIVPEVL
jgi:predicted RNase H-like HicB family nuclease